MSELEPDEAYALYLAYAIMAIGVAGLGWGIYKLFAG